MEVTETELQIGYYGDMEYTGEKGYLTFSAYPSPGIFFTPEYTGKLTPQMWFRSYGALLAGGSAKNFGGDAYPLLTHNDIKLDTGVVRIGSIGIACGTVVARPNGTSMSIITNSSINSLFDTTGSGNSNTIVLFANGDGGASSAHIDGATYQSSAWYAVFDRSVTSNIRINYVVIRWNLPVNPL